MLPPARATFKDSQFMKHRCPRRRPSRLITAVLSVGLLSMVLAVVVREPRTIVSAHEAPTGDVVKGEFSESKIYPGQWHEYWAYIPKQLDRAKPAPMMVFQDGLQYNAPVVFDQLIEEKAIPPMVGVFVMHGRVRAPSADALDRMNRSFEYDAVSDEYARFLLEEMLPFVAKTHGLILSTEPNDRGIAGNSS